ncbi:uncharacterized protein [Ptychodera flava]
MHSRIDREVKEKNALAIITQNRLTRGVGIFNKGKKSDTILRESLPMPEKAKLKTAEDMKKILDLSDAGLNQVASLDTLDKRLDCSRDIDNSMDWQNDASGSTNPPKDLSNITDNFHHSGSMVKNHQQTPPGSGCPEMDAVMEIDEAPGKGDSPDEMPQEIPFQEVAKRLISGVDVAKTFPGRDYLSEIRNKLQKTMKCSMMRTPPRTICLSSKSDSTAKRSLQTSIDSKAQCSSVPRGSQESASKFSLPKSMEYEQSIPGRQLVPRTSAAVSSQNIADKMLQNETSMLQDNRKSPLQSQQCEAVQPHRHGKFHLSPWQQGKEFYGGGLSFKAHTGVGEHFETERLMKQQNIPKVVAEFYPSDANSIWPSAAEIESSDSFALFESKRDLIDDLDRNNTGHYLHHHQRYPGYHRPILRPCRDSDTDTSPLCFASSLPPLQKPSRETPSPEKLFRPMRMF